jgi:hypothetical protein
MLYARFKEENVGERKEKEESERYEIKRII